MKGSSLSEDIECYNARDFEGLSEQQADLLYKSICPIMTMEMDVKKKCNLFSNSYGMYRISTMMFL